ncbi:MAG TPA: class E sortase [Acidimicrobiales bacterium]
MRGHRVLKRVAMTFVTVGVLLLSFVAYQLWGTALYEHHAQDQLRQELQQKLGPTTTSSTTSPTTPGTTSPTTTTPAPALSVAPTTPAPKPGTPIGLLTIPRMGMSGTAIVEGTDENQLQQGPGHYQGTPLPGQGGNAAIAGHRTTYGAPFYNLNELQAGDPIMIQTSQGTFTYQVVMSHVVDPSNTAVLDASTGPELTLTTCNPRYSAATRLVVLARLTSAALTIPPTTVPTSTPTSSTSTTPVTLPKSLGGGVGEAGGLSGVSTRGQVELAILWGALTLLAAVVGLVGWRRGRRPWSWVVFAMGAPLTVAGLLVCYQHISLALPQSF